MTKFNDQRPRDKWQKYQTLKSKWYCPHCQRQTDPPRRADPISRASIHCAYCGYELTRRTGGGQADPFRWHLGKPQPPNITDQLRQALQRELGPKTLPTTKLPTGRVEVKSGATYQTPLTSIARKAKIDPGQLSKFLHQKATLSLATATRLAQVLRLKLTKY